MSQSGRTTESSSRNATTSLRVARIPIARDVGSVPMPASFRRYVTPGRAATRSLVSGVGGCIDHDELVGRARLLADGVQAPRHVVRPAVRRDDDGDRHHTRSLPSITEGHWKEGTPQAKHHPRGVSSGSTFSAESPPPRNGTTCERPRREAPTRSPDGGPSVRWTPRAVDDRSLTVRTSPQRLRRGRSDVTPVDVEAVPATHDRRTR